MIFPIRQGTFLTAAAAENDAASDDTMDTSAAVEAEAAWGTVEPTAADDADVREAVKPTAANDADSNDGLCRRACHDHHHHHSLHDPLNPRGYAPGRCLAA